MCIRDSTIYDLSNYLCPTKYRFIKFSVVLTSLGGFEPSTYGLEGRCSIQLSYRLILISPFQKALRISTEKRVMGIEPTYPAWKAGVLPLNYTRTKSGWQDSNLRPPGPKPGALAKLSHTPKVFCFVSFKLFPRDTRVIISELSSVVNNFFQLF